MKLGLAIWVASQRRRLGGILAPCEVVLRRLQRSAPQVHRDKERPHPHALSNTDESYPTVLLPTDGC